MMKVAQKQTNNANRSTAEASQCSRQTPIAQVTSNSKKAVAQRTFAASINSSLRMAAQRQQIETYQKPASRNNTGLPDQLKTGIEYLSGLSMDDVRVHYNSPKPAQLKALAYTQGADIHVAPGQSQHLPHEAWHVVQQKLGRVAPTTQMKGVSVNNDTKLEKEADVMGQKASQVVLKDENSSLVTTRLNLTSPSKTGAYKSNAPIQYRADPKQATEIIAYIKEGTANYGVFILQHGSETVVVKFSKEDTRRAEFADKVLETTGIRNTNATRVPGNEHQAIINNITNIVSRYNQSGTADEKQIVASITPSVLSFLSNSVSVLAMDWMRAEKFSETFKDAQQQPKLPDYLHRKHKHTFYYQLGKFVAADTLLGNSDRFSYVTSPANKKKKLKSKSWVVANDENFKVNELGIIQTIDNDTEIAGLELLQQINPDMDTKKWVGFLIKGGREHIGKAPDRRITPNLEALFDQTKRQAFFDELNKIYAAYKVVQNNPDNFNDFDSSFTRGIQDAIQGMLRQKDELLLQAEQIGGDDKGGGMIDRDALKIKMDYLELRSNYPNLSSKNSLSYMRYEVDTESQHTKLNRVIQFGKANTLLTDEQAITITALLAPLAIGQLKDMLHISKLKATKNIGADKALGKRKNRLEAARVAILLKFLAHVETNPGDITGALAVAQQHAKDLRNAEVDALTYIFDTNKTKAQAALSAIGVDLTRWW